MLLILTWSCTVRLLLSIKLRSTAAAAKTARRTPRTGTTAGPNGIIHTTAKAMTSMANRAKS